MHEPPHQYLIAHDGTVRKANEQGINSPPLFNLNVMYHYEAMQYTGLDDAEGTPIFEGDVLDVPGLNTTVVVEYDSDAARWMAVGVKYHRDLHSQRDGIIIGNRYEDPALLHEVTAQ